MPASQPVATRPLAIQINGTWYTYGWDLTKNICELYSTEGRISTTYTYSPFGKVAASGSLTQPIQWSSEFNDTELSLVYYNWRYYNALAGRWNRLDLLHEKICHNILIYANNNPISKNDIIGLYVFAIDGTNFDVERHYNKQYSFVYDFHKRCFTSEDSEYQGGPGSVWRGEGILDATGFSVDYVLRKVKKSVCKKHCANQTKKLNFVGWSRGAIIAQDLVRDLGVNGCCCDNGKIIKNITVNFLGLYDAVARTPHRKESYDKPSNVTHYVHVYNTLQPLLFRTYLPDIKDPNEKSKYYKENNIYPGLRHDGMPSEHGDIGGAHDAEYTNAHSIIVNWAKNSGVAIDNTNLDMYSFYKQRERFKR